VTPQTRALRQRKSGSLPDCSSGRRSFHRYQPIGGASHCTTWNERGPVTPGRRQLNHSACCVPCSVHTTWGPDPPPRRNPGDRGVPTSRFGTPISREQCLYAKRRHGHWLGIGIGGAAGKRTKQKTAMLAPGRKTPSQANALRLDRRPRRAAPGLGEKPVQPRKAGSPVRRHRATYRWTHPNPDSAAQTDRPRHRLGEANATLPVLTDRQEGYSKTELLTKQRRSIRVH